MNIRVEGSRPNSYNRHMRRGAGKRCPVSGLPRGRIDDKFTDLVTGNFDPATPDCDTFGTSLTVALVYGPRANVARAARRMLADPRCACVVIGNTDGPGVPSLAGTQSSLAAYRDIWAAERRDRWTANLNGGAVPLWRHYPRGGD